MAPPLAITLSPPAEPPKGSSSGNNSNNTQSTKSRRDSSNYAKYSTETSSQTTPFEESVHDDGFKSSGGETTKPTLRKVKPLLIETSQSHGRIRQRRDSDPEIKTIEQKPRRPQPTRPFVPQLLETSRDTRLPDVSKGLGSDKERADRKRIFHPQLLETTRHSRRAHNTNSLLYAERSNVDSSASPSFSDFSPRKLKLDEEPQISPKPVSIYSPSALSFDARKFGTVLPKRTLSQSSSHSHSYQGPGLETIESSESDSSAQQSPITSHSPSPVSFSYISQVHRARECVDNHSGFLLAKAARNAQKQLRDQALAAFPNDDTHEPITHYVDRFDATPAPSSRGSHYDADFLRRSSSHWELKEIQKHHEMLEVDREKEKKRREARRKLYKHLDENPWSMPVTPTTNCPTQAPESFRELQKMLEKARPPMLGKDLVFPRSQSPDSARFDVTQGPESLKKTMCYLSNVNDRSESSSPSMGGLWCAPPPPKTESVASHQWSRPTSRAPSTQGGGLWGGSCLESGISPPSSRPTGIMTPRFDEDELNAVIKVGFNVPAAASAVLQNLPPSPPASTSGIACSFEGRLESPEIPDIEEPTDDFSDRFITQVYNYLSLGYPAVARDYDEELSKISRVSVSELRADDSLATGARGYIRLGEEELCEGVTEDMCARWRALKSYILEWGKQQPNMSSKPRHVEGLWGAARKGSWAV